MTTRSRVAVVVIALVAALAGPAPPAAHATVVGAMQFQGTLAIGAGIAYPCIDPAGGVAPIPTPPPVNLAKCGLGPPNAAGAVLLATGVGAIGQAAAAKCAVPACAEAGTFAIGGAGAITGACGLSTGALAGAIAPVVAVGTKAKPRAYAVTYVETAGLVVITGATAKGETITGVAYLVLLVGTCADKLGKVFAIVGSLQFLAP